MHNMVNSSALDAIRNGETLQNLTPKEKTDLLLQRASQGICSLKSSLKRKHQNLPKGADDVWVKSATKDDMEKGVRITTKMGITKSVFY